MFVWKSLKWTAILIVVLGIIGSVFAQGEERSVNFSPVDENPVLTVGADGEWDDVSIRFPFVLFHEEMFHMFYTAYSNSETPQAIGYASSDDGIHWTKHEGNPIFEGSGNNNFDDFGVNRPVVMVEDDGTWVMYYNGNAASGLPPFGKGIGRATATSPTGPWTRSETPVLEAGALRRWDGAFIFPDSVLKTDDGYVMYYSGTGGNQGMVGMVGMATSPDGITWTKYDDPSTTNRPFDESDPVLLGGEIGDWDGQQSWGAGVQQSDNAWEMTYTGGATTGGVYQAQVGYAHSDDGIHWTKYADNPIISVDDHSTLFTSLVIHEGQYFVYYGLTSTNGEAFTEAHLAIGTVE
jgi:predicted GH43/DUF377 family glycosyl hydrolase